MEVAIAIDPFQVVYLDVGLEVGNNSLVSWFITYVRDLQPTYIGVKSPSY